MRVVDLDGNSITNCNDEPFTVPPAATTHFYQNHRTHTPIVNLVFPDYGDYVVEWLLDGNHIHRANITVTHPGSGRASTT